MKAIFCQHCRDIVAVRDDIRRPCDCGKSWGRLLSNGTIEISLDAVCIGIPDAEFQRALNNRPDSGRGTIFPTFLMPRQCASVIVTQ